MCALGETRADWIFRQAFEFVDRDGSGVLDAAELESLFRIIGQNISKGELEMLMKVSRAGDG